MLSYLEVAVLYRLSIAAAAATMMDKVRATAAERSTCEVVLLPITPRQIVALAPGRAQQGLAARLRNLCIYRWSRHRSARLTFQLHPEDGRQPLHEHSLKARLAQLCDPSCDVLWVGLRLMAPEREVRI